MANKNQMVIVAGTTSYTTDIVLLSATDGSEMTGKVAADVTAYYWRQGGTPTAISLSDLAAIDSAWSSAGFKEAEATNMKGSYRLDPPNAAFASGADWVELNAFCTGSQVYKERFPIVTAGAVEVKVDTAAIKLKTDALPAAPAAVGDVTAVPAAVWVAGSRTLTAFGFTVNLATHPFDALAASHDTAGTLGELLNNAGVAADPLLNAVPGAYAAGTAGFTLGNLASDTAAITAIKAKTDQLVFTLPGLVDASSTGGLTAAQIATAVLTTAMTEAYPADGATASLTEAIYLIMQFLGERTLSGTTLTIKKLDGSTTAATYTTNSAGNPTSYSRTT